MTVRLRDVDLLIDAARRAGALVMQYFGTELKVHHKSPGQPLTAADLAADRLLHELLTGARPEYGWLSEETADGPDRLTRRRVWIVDPIDGTRSFIAGLPEFTLSLGLVEDGAVIAGVVHNPALDELYSASRGEGAWVMLQGGAPQRLSVSARGLDGPAAMLASRSEIAAGEFDAFRKSWRIEPAGSTAYKLALIASGRAEAFLSRGPKSEWDICAGTLLVTEAGGAVTDLAGERPCFNRADPYVHGILGTNGTIHDALLRRASELRQPERLRRQRHDPLHPGLNREE